ncbi:MAG: YDG domain-containing protein [Lachnospiraceae bacterium]
MRMGRLGKRVKQGAALLMAGLMMFSAVDLSAVEVRAEENTAEGTEENTAVKVAENAPEYMRIGGSVIISDGELQDDGIADNENTIYHGTNWYYDSIENQLVLKGASVSNIRCMDGDLTVLLFGENNLHQDLAFYSDTSGKKHTLELKGGDNTASLTCDSGIGAGGSVPQNLNIMGITIEISDKIGCEGNLKLENSRVVARRIDCGGSLSIGNSHVIVNNDIDGAIEGNEITITDSYVEAKTSSFGRKAIDTNQKINVSDSQIVACADSDFEKDALGDGDFTNSVITKQWFDRYVDAVATKTYVYGTAMLREALTVASGETIDFKDGASITNLEKLTVEDGATILVDGVEHIHNKDGAAKYIWKDGSEHTKADVCLDCPVGYTWEPQTEAHHYNEQGSCTECGAYQPAVLTTDKYDVNYDDMKESAYEISNAGQLYWFAGLVNGTLPGVGQDTAANAVLTYDITLNENVMVDGKLAEDTSGLRSWTPIGSEASPYEGIFDGTNHVINGLFCNDTSMSCAAFVGYLKHSHVRNLTLKDCWISGSTMAAGICGKNDGMVSECYVDGIITAQNDIAGGVCGLNNFGSIKNCYNAATVAAESLAGGICGSNPTGGGLVSCCMNIGNVTAKSAQGPICGYNNDWVTVGFCYYLSDTEIDEISGTTAKNADEFASGEVAYLLQDTQSKIDIFWGQTIGTDSYPVLGGRRVYKNNEYDSCDENGNVVAVFYLNEQKNKYTHTLVEIPAVGHCTDPGTDTYWECSECGKMFGDKNGNEEITVIPVMAAVGHDYGLSVETSEDGTVSSAVFTCKREGCEDGDTGHRESITITAPDKAGLIFDGNAKEAAVTSSQNVPENIPEIVYAGDKLADGKPVNAGTYTASITVGQGEAAVTAAVTYEIGQVTPEIGYVSGNTLNDTLDINAVKLDRTDNTMAGTLKLKDDTALAYGSHVYTYVFTPDDSNYREIEGTVSITVMDTVAPTAAYKLGTDEWRKFINSITLGRLYKDYETVELTYNDKAPDGVTDGSGVVRKQYYVSDKVIEKPENAITDDMWKDYTEKFYIDAAGTYFIYVRVADYAGNVAILNSEGVGIYADSNISPSSTEYSYKENKDCGFDVALNGNTFNRLTDGEGNSIAPEVYTLDADGKLTLRAEYMDTLTTGSYTYNLYMNPQGVETDKVELVYIFTVNVKPAELTVTGATAVDRLYDASDKVDISAVTVSGVRAGEDVFVDTTGLQGTLENAAAGSYLDVLLPQLTLTGAASANYKLVQPEGKVPLSAKVTIGKAPAAPNMPGTTMNVPNRTKKVGEIALRENWVWQDAYKDTLLEVEQTVKAVAVYAGEDKGNYETERVEIAITRSSCDHSYTSKVTKEPTTEEVGERTYTCTLCGYTYTETIAKLPDSGSGDTGKDNADKDNTDKDNTDNTGNTNKDNTGNGGSDSGKPFIAGDSSKSGWEAITEQVEAAQTGATITVDMNGTTTVPSGLLEQIKGKDINIVFDMGNGIRWTVSGKNVTEIKGDINIGVTVGAEAGKTIPVDIINSITGERTSINLTLAYSGEFGFTATLTVNVKAENAGYYANLFYYNQGSNKLDFVCAGQIDKSGNVELTFTHASDYTIVIADTVLNGKNTDTNPDIENPEPTNPEPTETETAGSEPGSQPNIEAPRTGDIALQNIWLILLGSVAIVIGAGIMYIKKRGKAE